MIWTPAEEVVAMAYDVPMPGFNTYNCNSFRLWCAKPLTEFDLKSFTEGDYYGAIRERQMADEITKVLCYGNCTDYQNEARLK